MKRSDKYPKAVTLEHFVNTDNVIQIAFFKTYFIREFYLTNKGVFNILFVAFLTFKKYEIILHLVHFRI